MTSFESFGRNALEPPLDMQEKILSTTSRDPIFYESSGIFNGNPWWFMNCLIPDHIHGKNLIGFGLDITHLKQAERRLAVHHAVTSVLVEATSIAEANKRVLQAICQNLHWTIGGIWEIDHQTQVLRCTDVWHEPSLRLDAFIAQTHGLTFGPGVGLPGRVWKQGEPAWIVDVAQDTNFPRASAANQEGLHGGFAFPIQVGAQMISVMEFFSQEAMQPDQELLNMFTAFGRQLGQFVERKQKERRLAVHNTVTSVLVEAESLSHANSRILETICKALHWEVGLLWDIDPHNHTLQCTEIWHAPSPILESLAAKARTLSLPFGKGLPGQVWQRREPMGILDVGDKTDHPLKETVAMYGLHGSFAFPIRLGTQIVCVMEFFSREAIDADEELRDMFTAIGIEIGHFTGHIQTETALKASEERERLILDSTGDAIMGIDQQGLLTFCNAASLKILGYSHESSLLGHNAHHILHASHTEGQADPVEECRLCQAALRGEHVHVNAERITKADGTSFLAEYWARPILKANVAIGSVITMKTLDNTP